MSNRPIRYPLTTAEEIRQHHNECQLRRAVAAGKYLGVVSQVDQLLDRLIELHADLDDGDALHQALHAVTFVWGYASNEIRMLAARTEH